MKLLMHMQVFCQKARAEQNPQLENPERHIVTDGNTTVMAVDPAKIMAINFGETDMVVMDMRNVCVPPVV